MGTLNFKPRQRADINKKLKWNVKNLKTIHTQNGITDYLKTTYTVLRVMSTLTVQWNRAYLKNNFCISASAALMSRPVAVDIHYTFYSTTHSTTCNNQWCSWLLITLHIFIWNLTHGFSIFSENAHWKGWSKSVFPNFYSMDEPISSSPCPE
jgi:hypothetical protein